MAGLGNVFWAFTFIAMGGLLFGYMIGINSNIVTKGQLLCEDTYTGAAGTWTSWDFGQCYNLSSVAMGFLSSLNLIGACLSSLVCFRYADDLGRKLEAQIAAVLFLGGALIAAGSPVLWGIFLGLLIYGLGIGFAMHAAPVYIAEISPAEIRGSLVSAKEAVIVLGIFLGFLSGFVFSSGFGSLGWRLMILSSGAVALAMFAGLASVPESPRFLMLKAVLNGKSRGCYCKETEAVSAALQFFRCASAAEVQQELLNMEKDTVESLSDRGEPIGEAEGLLGGSGTPQGPASFLDAFLYPRPLVVGCGLVLLQQVTGQPSVLYYATNIFKDAGFGDSAALQSVGLGLVKLIATLFTVWRVDSYGRRLLLFIGISMMALALGVIAMGFQHSYCSVPDVSYANCNSSDVVLPREWAILTVIALMLYVSGYQVGFGPISWLMISEIFPLKVRGSALSVAAIVNFGSNIAVTFSTAPLMEAFSAAGLFFIFLCFAFASLAFVAALVPETKGRSLEEIEAMMKLSDVTHTAKVV